MRIWASISVRMKLKDNETEEQAEMRIKQIINSGLCSSEENQILVKIQSLKIHEDSYGNAAKNIKEKDWYRCTTRKEMISLIQAGFDYINFRKDKYNNGNITYYFEKNKQLEEYINMNNENQLN